MRPSSTLCLALLLTLGATSACKPTCGQGATLQADGLCHLDTWVDPNATDTDTDAVVTDTTDTVVTDTDVPDDDLPVSPITTFLGDISFYSAESMRQFCAKYDRIYGNASITGPEFTDAEDFACLKEVQGSLTVSRTRWTTWHLPNLEVAGWGLSVLANADLTSFAPAQHVMVGDSFTIDSSPLIADLDMSSLTVRGGIAVRGMDGITEFAMAQAEPMEGPVAFGACANLAAIDLSGVTLVASSLNVSSNPALTSFDGSGITSSAGLTYLFTNPNLTYIDLSGLTELVYPLFSGNGEGLELRLTNVTVAHFGLSLGAGLNHVDLGSLSNVEGNLVITQTTLQNLDTLAALRAVEGSVTVDRNLALTNATGLAGIDTVSGNLSITSNPLLGQAAAQSVADAIGRENIAGTVTISNN